MTRDVKMRAAALVMAVTNAGLFLVCQSNVAANNLFVLKATVLYDAVVVSSSVFYWMVPAALLLLPLWRRIAARILPGFTVPPAAVLASCLLGFPFFAVDLSAPIPWIDLIRATLRDGVVQPAAFLFCLIGLRGLVKGQDTPARPQRVVLAALLCIFALRLITAGPALPRLEDETGYHIQALIFASGKLKGDLPVLAAIPPESIAEALRLPFLGIHQTGYYSLHMHGWPAILALARTADIAGFTGAILWITNIALFYWLARRHLTDERILTAAVFMFGLSPLLLFLSGTMMAHTAALTLSMLILLLYEGTDTTARGWLCAVLALLTTSVLFQTRPQALVPLTAALAGASAFEAVRGRERKENALRILSLALGAAAGWLFFQRYAAFFGNDFPVNREPCNAPGFGPGHGCFPTYGTLGHTPLKAFFNTADLLAGWNHELAAGSLPILVLALWLLTRVRTEFLSSRPAVISLLTVAASVVMYGQFFHNGGESYHGRYLADSAFALPLLVGLLLERLPGREQLLNQIPSFLLPACLLAAAGTLFFQIRGEYFHPHFEPFRRASSLPGGEAVRDALLFVEEKHEGAQTTDAFTSQPLVIPRSELKRSLNLGAGTLAATAVRIEGGFLKDKDGNILAGEMSRESARKLAGVLGRRAWAVQFSAFEPVTRSSRFMRFFKRSPPRLEEIQ